jgi:hypothetical protein
MKGEVSAFDPMNPIELYYSLKPYPLADFGSYFSRFQNSAFRLEMLNVYSVAEEEKPFAAFERGEQEADRQFNKDWHEILERASEQGKHFSRVRIASEPISNYLRFEVKWGYETNVLKGEHIRFLIAPDITSLSRLVPILKDFWLFDDSDCFLMDYDNHGRFLGVAKLPDDLLAKYAAFARELTELSIPFTDGKNSLGLT